MFSDRQDAGLRLADRLAHLRGTNPTVLGIPRGGIVVAAVIARSLDGTLDVLITRKIPSPHHPEVAVGAVAPDGSVILHPELAQFQAEGLSIPGAPPQYLDREVERCLAEIGRRRQIYARGRPMPDLTDAVIILVDDGIATGFTALAALRWLNMRAPAKVVLAVPVAPPDVLDALAPWCDQIVCVEQPVGFEAVSHFYRRFDQTADAEVARLIAGAREGKPSYRP